MRVLITGGTGYLGRPLTTELVRRGHQVRVLARPGSAGKASRGAEVREGDPLSADSIAAALEGCDTLVHLVGTPKPAPWKGAAFRALDRPSAFAAIEAARWRGIRHFVYVSVAHPSPIMKSYIEVRRQCEARLFDSGLTATVLRPWYVLGPGHWWPYALIPAYWIGERIPGLREGAVRLGLVRLDEMVAALVRAVEDPPPLSRIWMPAAIRKSGAQDDRGGQPESSEGQARAAEHR